MIKIIKISLFFAFLVSFFGVSQTSWSYPDSERAQLDLRTTGGITSQATQMYLKDDRYLYIGFDAKVKVADMGMFQSALDTLQPYDFGSDSDFSGDVGGLVLSSSNLYVTLTEGDLLTFPLATITAKPTSKTISDGDELGKVAINSTGTYLYILNMTDNSLIRHTIGTTTNTTIDLTYDTLDFDVTNITLVQTLLGSADHVYVTTNKGVMFDVADGETVANPIVVDTDGDPSDNLIGVTHRPGTYYLYVIDYTDKSIKVVNASTSTVISTISMEINPASIDPPGQTYNESLSGIVATSVTNPSSTYVFVSGDKGLTVIDANDALIDVLTNTTDTYKYNPVLIDNSYRGPVLAASDGYLYMTDEGGFISVISDRPYSEVTDVSYETGSTLGVGEYVDITFNIDEDASYAVKVNGDMEGSGEPFLDDGGSSTGSVTADTDTTLRFNYDDNSANLEEGDNIIFFFGTSDSSSLEGRGGVVIDVDTPPPATEVLSVGFGDTRLYVTMTRVDVSDMDHYNVYVSTDPDAVVNKTVTPQEIEQPSSGSTLVGQLNGLTNNSLYYISVETVDEAGNLGPLVYTYSSGSRITGTPRETVGPAELSGERGCSLGGGNNRVVPFAILLLLLGGIWFGRKHKKAKPY